MSKTITEDGYEIDEKGRWWQIIDYVSRPFKIEVCPQCHDAGIFYVDDGVKRKYPFCHWCGYEFPDGEYPEE